MIVLHEPVARQESITILLPTSASKIIILKGSDISAAYLHSNPNVPIFIHQPTVSRNDSPKLEKYCPFRISLFYVPQIEKSEKTAA